MPLAFVMVLLLVVALGLVQAWTIWFLKREVQRLEFRLGEALDDEDLLEFQERLRALLTQAKETARGLVDTVDKRKQAFDQILERAKDAEKSLALRLLAKSAADSVKPLPKPQVKLEMKPASRREPKVDSKPKSAKPATANASKPPLKAAPVSGKAAIKSDAVAKDPVKPAPKEEISPLADAGRRFDPIRASLPAAGRYQKIYDLSDRGLAVEQVAKQSGMLAGEVELILNLRRKAPPID